MNIILSINKPISYTPNQIIEKVRSQFPHFAKEKIGFAGRLDPMAKGVLLLLVGDANFEREKYLNLNKTYQFSALLGLETDSYDLLGILHSLEYKNPPGNSEEVINNFLSQSIGKKIQPYPPFSTKPVQGKELFKWAREGKIAEIEIPTKEVEIYNFKQLSQSNISAPELQKTITERIAKIEGFFRQEEILKKWNDFFKINKQANFKTITFEVKCSSGTYVRSLVHNLGKNLGSGAVTLEIYRTKVGSYSIDNCLELSL
jgi:tRNA pseudouridine55 synthase